MGNLCLEIEAIQPIDLQFHLYNVRDGARNITGWIHSMGVFSRPLTFGHSIGFEEAMQSSL